jgi:hypothetical protein
MAMTQDIWRWLLNPKHVNDNARNTLPTNNTAVRNDDKENEYLFLPHRNSQARFTTYLVVCVKDIIATNNSSSSCECPKFHQYPIIFIWVIFVSFVTTYRSAIHCNLFRKVHLKNIRNCGRMEASMQFLRLLTNHWEYISNFDKCVKKNWAGQWELKSLIFPAVKTQLCTNCVTVNQGKIKEYFVKVFRIYLSKKII